MNALYIFRQTLGVAALLASFYAQAYPGESIVLDPVTGDYTITYWDDVTYGDTVFEQPSLRQTTFVPATKINPVIRSRFKIDGASDVAYNYTISNGATAKQAIVVLGLEKTGRIKGERNFSVGTATMDEIEQAIFANMTALNGPEDWSGNIHRVLGYSRIAWRSDDLKTGGVKAGDTQPGFGFTSPDLPGISEAQMEGIGAVFGYSGEGPAEDSAILPEFDRLRENNFVVRPAAVPTIAVPEPFDAAVTLERIQTHMHSWIAMQLLDPAFSAQLDRTFQSAISAYRLNQPKVGKQHIQTLRALIKKEQPDADKEDADDSDEISKNQRALIDKLAARVLDFDLKYVSKRMSGDD